MKKALVGYTGFVGSNIYAQSDFEGAYNSKNIQDAFGTKPDILVFAGLPAEKFLANNFPEEDFKKIQEAIENIEKINPSQIVLISTIDVYNNPVNVNEDSNINYSQLSSYGKHRLILENFVTDNFQNHLIVRLPGLFGKNIKKNFIYDMINVIPHLIKEEKYKDLSQISNLIKKNYVNQGNGFYKCIVEENERVTLRQDFEKIGFSALNFTDSRGIFQYYHLDNLWKDITVALYQGINKINITTEPIKVDEIYNYVYGRPFINEFLTDNIPFYDCKTKYAELYNGRNGYMYNKVEILSLIKNFVKDSQNAVFNI